jgi:hypothetical protein
MFLRLNVRQIILLFSEDLSATQIFHLTKISRPAVNKYLTAIRLRILELSLLQSDPLVGQIEVDESYFGARRARGKRGRGARGKTIVFGLLKRGDKVYTEIVPNCKRVLLYKRLSRVRRTLIVLFIQMVVGIMV